MKNEQPLSKAEFETIYSKVPRLTVEILLLSKRDGVLMSLRDIEPCKGLWHLPGGTVHFGEKLTDAVKRIAKREIRINVNRCSQVGYIEYPSHYENGLDSPIGLVFLVEGYSGTPILNDDAKAISWFSKLPENMHPDQDTWLLDHNYIKA